MSEPILREDDPSATDSALETAKRKTKAYGRTLWEIVTRHSRVDFLQEEPEERSVPARFEYEHKSLLKALTLFPYLLVATFAASFAWDFQGVTAGLFGYTLEFQGLLKIISVSGMIGFLTNWLAITMLFKPSKKRPILGHGLIPAQKDRIAYRLAQTVSEDLINPEIIKRKIHQSKIISRYREQATVYIRSIIDAPAFRNELKQWVVNYIDDMIANPEIRSAIAKKILIQIEESIEDKSIERVALKAYSFIKGQEMQNIIEEALIKLPETVESGLDKVDELLDRLPDKIEDNSDTIEDIVTNMLYKLVNRLDVRALVEDNLRQYDEQKLSDIIRGATNEQLRYIQYLGAVLGTVGGFVIWQPVISLLFLTAATLLILSVDSLLYRYRKDNL